MSLILQRGKNYRSGRSGKRTFGGTCGSGSDSSEKIRCFVGRDSRFQEVDGEKREALFSMIPNYFYVGIGRASVEEIEAYNILNATFLAMRRAIAQLEEQISIADASILVDGNFKIRECQRKQEAIVKGDAKSLSIAAASIMAKVTRDHELLELAKRYPEYRFEKHKGYGTKMHREQILSLGAIPGVHRNSFLVKILQKK